MKGLTEKQQRILDYIIEATSQNGFPPSVREIGEYVGLKSSSSVHAQLSRLRELGYLAQQIEGKKRALVVNRTQTQSGMVPILGRVTAGVPILAVEEVQGYLPYERAIRAGEYFALRVKGDSMIGAGILDGDCIIIRQQAYADSGQIVVALLEDEATCKTLHIDEEGVWLLPENPAYKPINGTDCSILGIVTAVHREYAY